MDLAPRSGPGARDGDSHVAAEGVEKSEQAIGGEAVEATVEQGRYFRLTDSQQFAGSGLGESATFG